MEVLIEKDITKVVAYQALVSTGYSIRILNKNGRMTLDGADITFGKKDEAIIDLCFPSEALSAGLESSIGNLDRLVASIEEFDFRMASK